MFVLLLAAAATYVVLGGLREAVVLAASILVVILITVLQERRTEHALTRLRDLSSPRALVIRDGGEKRIAGREVVAGDVVVLREGDRVPADGVLLSSTALSVDESILTGESLPVDKSAFGRDKTDADTRIYCGSLVVRGYGTAQVTVTGLRTEIGKIGRALATLHSEVTPLFLEVRRIVRWVASAGLLLCAAIALLYGAARNDWLGGVLAGITLAMSVLPEEFPVVLTVFLAMGAWRISRAGVLTRRMPAVESIGAVTVLAVDKTGTLTENRMRIALVETTRQSFDLRAADVSLPEDARGVLETAHAASELDAFDPMERAILEATRHFRASQSQRPADAQLVREYDLTPELLAVTHVWQRRDSATFEVAVKGAPETVLEMCRIGAAARVAYLERVASHAADGLRVLAVARGEHRDAALPQSPSSFELSLLGFVCLADPLRSNVPAALSECAQAGIRVVMITGDHPGTALAIARQSGFDVAGGVVTGTELDAMSDDVLTARTRTVNVFARAKPHHKLRLVQAFKSNGEVIAMTGDGVNDAPALKAAHVGVAMGARGTDVAREAAALVLVNDDFASLVAAVRLGRRIYGNIRHAMSYIVAVHIPVAGMGLLPVLLGWPLLLSPIHVLFLEFVIDPACAFVFEADAAPAGIMQRPPRRHGDRLFSRAVLRPSIGLGVTVLALVAGVYALALAGATESEARALAFLAIVIANLTMIFVSRSRSDSYATLFARSNRIFWWIAASTTLALGATMYVPVMASVFRFSAPSPTAALAVVTVAILLPLLSGLLQRQRSPVTISGSTS
jgi:Ca2+-transporting ATPase